MNLREIVVPLLWIGLGAFGAGLLAMLKGVPKKWVDTWIEDRFKSKQDELNRTHQEKLGELNHEYQTKLEGVRSEIQTTFSRVAKVHEKEFEVLPKAWLYLHEAWSSALDMPVNVITGNLSAVDKMTPEEFKEFLEKTDLTTDQKIELASVGPDDRFRHYITIRETTNAREAEKKRITFQNYLVENRIFISMETCIVFTWFLNALIDGTHEFRIGTQLADQKLRSNGEATIRKLEARFPELEQLIQKRLHQDKA